MYDDVPTQKGLHPLPSSSSSSPSLLVNNANTTFLFARTMSIGPVLKELLSLIIDIKKCRHKSDPPLNNKKEGTKKKEKKRREKKGERGREKKGKKRKKEE